MDELLLRASLAAAVLGLATGPIGCFILWRRMAYLGSSLAEMALLGVALGLLLSVSPLLGVLTVSLIAALLLARPWELSMRGSAAREGLIPTDTRIGLVGHAGLALGFIVLALSYFDIGLIALVAALALAVLAAIWKPLLADSVSADILAAEHGASKGPRARSILLMLVAGLIAFGLQIVGALLIVALLIIPAAAARPLARTPESMAVIAAFIGAAAAPLGIFGAFIVDAPAGPAIVLAAAALFAISSLAARLLKI
jgi:zinc transport system permease protein